MQSTLKKDTHAAPPAKENPYLVNMRKLAEMGAQFWQVMANKPSPVKQDSMALLANNLQVTQKALQAIWEHPEQLAKYQVQLATDYMKIWGNVMARFLGQSDKPLYAPDPKDRRFRDPAWEGNLAFDFIKQSYLLTAHTLKDMASNVKGLDARTAKQFDFYVQQFTDALSPSNFLFTNPQVIRETVDSKGENLVKGFKHLLEDLNRSGNSFLQISTTAARAFRLGENIACTPGKVVYQNKLMQLIQYEPTQKQTYRRPLLLIPAWINKFYILDLSPENSFVKWLVGQGYTVFVISWVNPTKEHAGITFEDYMQLGPLAALDAIYQATGEKEATALGYCLGGTLLACMLAWMKAKGDERIKAATLITTMVDFSDAGELQALITEPVLKALEAHMDQLGYLDGHQMATMFNSLRANDLIWSFVVNNYLLGKEPFPFDILYWNADTTRLPATTHSFYLRNTYLQNLLSKPGGVTLGGVRLDMRTVSTPTYILSTCEDHIAPWKTTYLTTQFFKHAQFVLATSGHVAGVINPPAKHKYSHWINEKATETAESWLQQAKEVQGSWWENWHQWNAALSGEKVPAPTPGSGKLKPLEDAPGSYVRG